MTEKIRNAMHWQGMGRKRREPGTDFTKSHRRGKFGNDRCNFDGVVRASLELQNKRLPLPPSPSACVGASLDQCSLPSTLSPIATYCNIQYTLLSSLCCYLCCSMRQRCQLYVLWPRLILLPHYHPSPIHQLNSHS